MIHELPMAIKLMLIQSSLVSVSRLAVSFEYNSVVSALSFKTFSVPTIDFSDVELI